MLREVLSDKTKNIIKTTLEERVFKPTRLTIAELELGAKVFSLPRHKNWVQRASNWNIICWSDIALAALATLDNEIERKHIVDMALKYTDKYLESFTSEGISREG